MRSRGFTLPETLIAVAIILIIGSGGLLMSGAYLPYYRLSTSSRELISGLRQAQQLTITQQITYRINLNQGNQSWQLIRIVDSTPTQLENHKLPTGISFSFINLEGQNYIDYNSAGVPSSAGTIVLANNKNQTITIQISPAGNIKSY